MAEALWVQQAGVDYSATEDRRLISALSSVGVVNGLVISAGAGLQVSVSAGTAIVDDGAAGAYVAYTTTATTLTLPASATTNIYITVNTTTAVVTVTSGSTPAGPYLAIGSATTNGTVVTTIPNAGISLSRALPPNAQGSYLKLTGGTVSGATTFTAPMTANGLITANGGINAPDGVRLGGASPTARHYIAITDTSTVTTTINRFATSTDFSVRESIQWNTASVGTTDYATNPFNPATPYDFKAGVAGYYALSGYVNTTGATSATRRILFTVMTGTDITLETYAGATKDDVVTFSGVVPLAVGQSVRVRLAHNLGGPMDVQNGRVNFRLIQAD